MGSQRVRHNPANEQRQQNKHRLTDVETQRRRDAETVCESVFVLLLLFNRRRGERGVLGGGRWQVKTIGFRMDENEVLRCGTVIYRTISQ